MCPLKSLLIKEKNDAAVTALKKLHIRPRSLGSVMGKWYSQKWLWSDTKSDKVGEAAISYQQPNQS